MDIFNNGSKTADLWIPAATYLHKLGTFETEHKNAILQTFQIVENETMDPYTAFKETTHLYASGRDIQRSTVAMNYIILLDSLCDKKTEIGAVYKWYMSNRLYSQPGGIKFQLGDLSVNRAYLISMQVTQVDPAQKTAVVTFVVILDNQ